jgi:ribosome-associated toxin RatA of RatAB toxin-antitoxin module
MSVSQGPGHAALLHRPAAECYRLFTDVSRLPEWLPWIRAARTQQTDAQGRPERVEYLAEAPPVTLQYALEYEYDPGVLSVRFKLVEQEGALTELEGWARFIPLHSHLTLFQYRLRVCKLPGIGMWKDPLYRRNPAESVTRAFRDWLARGAEPPVTLPLAPPRTRHVSRPLAQFATTPE